MKIYTKTGDRGETSLVDGTRVPKNHPRVEAYGTVDELNSMIGWCAALVTSESSLAGKINTSALYQIQNTLFNLGSHLAAENEAVKAKLPNVLTSDIEMLEKEIDQMTLNLPELKEFILPGGHPAAAAAHMARTLCRRAERRVLSIEKQDDLSIKFLNRLSDYFFVFSRDVNMKAKVKETTWKK
jgi:cob(I)alamin adenosyltransferase